jgi:hypothetical protein
MLKIGTVCVCVCVLAHVLRGGSCFLCHPLLVQGAEHTLPA